MRLSILDLSTSVGLRYGYYHLNLEAFLGSMEPAEFIRVAPSIPYDSQDNVPADLPTRTPYSLRPRTIVWLCISFSVPPSHNDNSTGMLTCFPSDTPFGLSLGPD